MPLIITGVIDGPLSGGLPKAIELTATEDIADLSLYGVESANNGAVPDAAEFTGFSGSLAAGTSIYVSYETTGFSLYFGFAPDYTSAAAQINGDDAILLYREDSVVDAFGKAGPDGNVGAWEYTDGWAARKPGTAPSSTFDPADWTFSGTDALDGANSNADAANPFPAGAYAGGGGGGPVEPPPEPEITLISTIQGSAGTGHLDVVGRDDRSAFVGQVVTVEAVVTADFQSELDGFFLQEEDGDRDGTTLTSEGIFVYDPRTVLDVSEGALVRVTGLVGEFSGQTQITAIAIEAVAAEVALPTAVEVTFPVASVQIDGGSYVANLEAYEGMRVTIPNDMTVTELFNLDRFGEYSIASERFEQFTQSNLPDADGYDAHLQDVARATVLVDDGRSVQNPGQLRVIDGNDGVLSTSDTFSMGDTLDDVTGVLGYGFREFRVQTPTGDYADTNPREPGPAEVGGNFVAASLNVLNYFTTLNSTTDIGLGPRGASSQADFEAQASKIVAGILEIDADVLGLVEIENDFAGDVIPVADLVARLNAELGEDVYDWVDPGQEFVGTDAIANALIYRTDRVATVGEAAILTEFEGRSFLDPLETGSDRNRASIAQTFVDLGTNETVTVSVNHLKSKGSSDGLDAGPEDGQGNADATRTAAAAILDDWLKSDPTGQGAENVLILGDLNSYAKEDPIRQLQSEGWVDLAEAALEEPYSYVFDGQIGTLDYALANGSLYEDFVGAAIWNINSDEADAYDYVTRFGKPADLVDPNSPVRYSDHDPVIVGFEFRNQIDGTDGNDRLSGTAMDDEITGFAGNDRIVAKAGDDIVFAGSGNDRVKGGAGDDVILGGAGNDRIKGGAGNDLLVAGSGHDRILGGAGSDTIVLGGGGGDQAGGGAGADYFIFRPEAATDGARDTTLIELDGLDTVDLQGVGIASVKETRAHVTLTLEGDGDKIRFFGVQDLDEIRFADPDLSA